jgi:hypothetical protein
MQIVYIFWNTLYYGYASGGGGFMQTAKLRPIFVTILLLAFEQEYWKPYVFRMDAAHNKIQTLK